MARCEDEQQVMLNVLVDYLNDRGRKWSPGHRGVIERVTGYSGMTEEELQQQARRGRKRGGIWQTERQMR